MSLEPTAKRASTGGHAVTVAVDDDRLSSLPDGLLHIVLSFLPAPQVVRTSVLSRRWRDLWRSTPCINIDEGEFVRIGSDTHELKEKWRKFEDFTTNLLLFHNNVASLDKFRIYAHARSPYGRDVDRWVRRGIKYCPQVLEILIRISSVVFQFPHLGASSCRLRRLRLQGVSLDSRFADLLCSGCPVLEDLVLRHCGKHFHKIASCTLKKLVVDACDNLTGNRLVITAPRLAHLQLGVSCGGYSNGISITETASLVKASTHLLCLGETFSLKNQRQLLANLSNVPNLELSGFQTMAMLIRKADELPIFPKLRTLSLEQCFLDKCDLNDKLDAVGSFAQNAPCLEKLTLQCCMFQVDSEMDGLIMRKSVVLQRQDQNTFQCPKLKSIEVLFFQEDNDYQLVEVVWGLGRRLPDANIILSNLFVA